MKPVVAVTFSNSASSPLNSLKREGQSIYDTLFSLHAADAIELYKEDYLDLEGIIEIFDRFEDRIYIFHFGGHGESNQLYFGDKPVPEEKFVALLGAQKEKAKLVFLNSIYSASMVPALLEVGVKTVIASTTSVNDDEAAEFAGLFYQALSKGASIQKSFDFAKNTLFPPEKKDDLILTRSLDFLSDIEDRQDHCPYKLYSQKDTEDLLNWKLPLPTSNSVIKKPTIVLHDSKVEIQSSPQKQHLEKVLLGLNQTLGIELYREKYVKLADIQNTFERFDQRIFLYQFQGAESWPVLEYLKTSTEEETEQLRSQLNSIKVFIWNDLAPGHYHELEALLELGIDAIVYSWEERDGPNDSIKFTAKLYQLLEEGDSLETAYNKAARYIWTLSEMDAPPSSIALEVPMDSSAKKEEQPPWGLYIKKGKQDILEWKLPKPTSRGIKSLKGKKGAIPTGKNYLLAIGVDQYQGTIPLLNNAVKDAKRFQQMMLDNFRFQKDQLFTLYDREATRKNILNTFDKLLETVTPEDNLILYFSGHGIVHKPTNRGYWLPINAKLNDRSTYLSNSEVIDFIQHLAARHVFGIIDSCFSASLFSQRSLDKVTERQYSLPSRWLLTAGRLEPVSDGSLGDHSPFANTLFAGLNASKNDVFWVSDLCQHVTKNIQYNVSSQVPRGEPLQQVGHQGGQFVFMGKETDMHDVWTSEEQGRKE